MSRLAVPIAALLACLALLAGCGSSDSSSGTSAQAGTEAKPTVIVETAAPGFNAARVYREALPGVVTIRSIFGSGAAEGSGFVYNSDGWRSVAHIQGIDGTPECSSSWVGDYIGQGGIGQPCARAGGDPHFSGDLFA